jgi:hypothetical protein
MPITELDQSLRVALGALLQRERYALSEGVVLGNPLEKQTRVGLAHDNLPGQTREGDCVLGGAEER